MEPLVKIFKALSDRNRLRVIGALLEYDELCACQIVELLQVTGATASRHMSVLISSGLVDSRKESRWVYYRLHRQRVEFNVLINWVNNQLSHDPDCGDDVERLKTITLVKPETLCRKQRGEACCPRM